MSSQELIHRLNRAVGQIESIKKKIESGNDNDCTQTLQQLKASINALKKFGEAYMLEHLDTCVTQGISEDNLKHNVKSIISGAFSL